MICLALLLLANPALAAERLPSPCYGEGGVNVKVNQACKDGADLKAARKVKAQCMDFAGKVKSLDERVENVRKECNKAGVATTKKSAKKSRGDQAVAEADTAAMAAESKATMSKCADGMGDIQKEYDGLSKTADQEAQGVSGLSSGCEAAVKESYEKLKKKADDRVEGAKGDTDQYTKGAGGAGKMAGANAKKAGDMDTAGGDQSAKKEGEKQGGGGGGGMPNLPQLPTPPKSPPQKSAAQLLQEQQAARQQQCQQLFTAYNTGVSTCDGQHPCHPEVARVQNICNDYNTCIAALAAFPPDCANPPTRAVAK